MVNVNELIDENLIILDLDSCNKNDAIIQLANLIHSNARLCCNNKCHDDDCSIKSGFIKALFEREETFSTAIGFGFGIPHGKCKFVNNACIAYARLKNEIHWDDEEDVKHIFMIGVSDKNAGEEHLEILIKLSTSILEEEFIKKLNIENNKIEVLNTIKEYTSRARN